MRIIHARVKGACEKRVDKNQFGFRQGYGTREALFAVNMLFQKCKDQRRDVFVRFLDYEKAFDLVKHEEIIRILKKRNVNAFDLQIIRNIHWKQTATVLAEKQETESISIRRGVRQGCILSPLLLNISSPKCGTLTWWGGLSGLIKY